VASVAVVEERALLAEMVQAEHFYHKEVSYDASFADGLLCCKLLDLFSSTAM